MTKQEEKWELMTILQMPWGEANKIKAGDRVFLLDKVVEIKKHIAAQRQQQAQQQQMQMQQQGQIITPSEEIFTP